MGFCGRGGGGAALLEDRNDHPPLADPVRHFARVNPHNHLGGGQPSLDRGNVDVGQLESAHEESVEAVGERGQGPVCGMQRWPLGVPVRMVLQGEQAGQVVSEGGDGGRGESEETGEEGGGGREFLEHRHSGCFKGG